MKADKTGVIEELEVIPDGEFDLSSFNPSKRSFKGEKSKGGQLVLHGLKTFLFALIIALGAIFLFRFTFSPTLISGNSMYPTLKDGQLWFSSSKVFHKPTTGDIVRAYSRDDMLEVVKRVVAKEGDTLTVNDSGGIFVNGEFIDNSETTQRLMTDSTSWVGSHVGQEVTLKSGEFFLLGDNRNQSKDSRYYGLVEDVAIETVLTGEAPDWVKRLMVKKQ